MTVCPLETRFQSQSIKPGATMETLLGGATFMLFLAAQILAVIAVHAAQSESSARQPVVVKSSHPKAEAATNRRVPSLAERLLQNS